MDSKHIALSASEARVISTCSKIDIEDEQEEAEIAFKEFREKYPIAGWDYRKDKGFFRPTYPVYGSCESLEDALRIIKERCELGEENAHPKIYDEELMKAIALDLTRLDYKATQCGHECDTLHINWSEEISDETN